MIYDDNHIIYTTAVSNDPLNRGNNLLFSIFNFDNNSLTTLSSGSVYYFDNLNHITNQIGDWSD